MRRMPRTPSHPQSPPESTHRSESISHDALHPRGTCPTASATTSTASSSTPSAARRSTCSTRCRTRPTCRPRPARRRTSTSPSPPRRARSPRVRGRACCPASARGCCTASPTSSSRATRSWPSWSPSTPGLPITQALGQARRAAENFRFFADLIVAQADDTYKVPGRQINYVNRKPIGVAGLITPWNTPFMLESWKLGPGARHRQHGRAQARRVHAAVGVAVGRDLRGGRAARGRLQPRQRTR